MRPWSTAPRYVDVAGGSVRIYDDGRLRQVVDGEERVVTRSRLDTAGWSARDLEILGDQDRETSDFLKKWF